MFIALVGTPSSGKHAVLDYLVQRHGFTRLDIGPAQPPAPADDSVEAGVDALDLDEWVGISPLLLSPTPLPSPYSLPFASSFLPSYRPSFLQSTRRVRPSLLRCCSSPCS